MIGKTCRSKEEIVEYMKHTIVGVRLSQHTPLLLNYDTYPPIKRYDHYIDFSISHDGDITEIKDYYY